MSGDGVETDILRERSSGRTGEAGVPERTAGVIEREIMLAGCTVADLVWSGVAAAILAIRGEWTEGAWLYGVGDVGDVARDRGSEDDGDVGAVVRGRGGESGPLLCREAYDLGGGVLGTSSNGAADLTFVLLASERRV